MDFDYFLRYLAVDVAIKNWDGARTWYGANNHNYFFYEEESPDGKIWIIPWDLDQTMMEKDNYFERSANNNNPLPQWNVPTTNCGMQFINGNVLIPPNCDKFTKLIAAVFWNRYVQLGDLFLKDLFIEQRLKDKIDKYQSLITNSVQQDPVINENTWRNDVNTLKNYLGGNITTFRNYLHP